MESCVVLGVPSLAGDLDDAAAGIVERATQRRGGYVCLANAHVLTTARRDPALREALQDAWGVFADGWPVAWLQRRLGGCGTRVAGADLMPLVLERGRETGLRHFFFGSTPEVIGRLQDEVIASSPGASIVGSMAPRYGEFDEESAAQAIAHAQPDVVWCALGAPRQEVWMRRWAPTLAPALLIGVGAAFDFLSGTKPRAPQWMQRAGLEWLHRMLVEPSRLAGRYFRSNPVFVVLALRAVARRDKPDFSIGDSVRGGSS